MCNLIDTAGSFASCVKANVDMTKALQKAGLANLFPTEVWPELEAVRKLEAKCRRIRKLTKAEMVFVYSDLRKYVLAT